MLNKCKKSILIEGIMDSKEIDTSFCLFFSQQGSCYVAQAGFELLGSSNPPASQVAGTTGAHHHTWLLSVLTALKLTNCITQYSGAEQFLERSCDKEGRTDIALQMLNSRHLSKKSSKDIIFFRNS